MSEPWAKGTRDADLDLASPLLGPAGDRHNRAQGVVTSGRYVANGAYLLSVIPAQGLWVDANFKEDQLAHMRPGQPATVVADVLPGKVFQLSAKVNAPRAA
jgi:membrane fusion protein (multidrug efflux system)